ncbi:hypothetical protein [Streptomyces achromogenes]|uniref:hypothetical protein n=1 Tax=Streptomyces achromogenes TaxID=67255 RepID=UPI0036CF485B
MRDRTSGPGDDRHRTERLSRAPGEEWTPEQDSPATDEWSPGDTSPGRRAGSRLRPEERPPREPGQAGSAGGWISGAGTPGTEAGRTNASGGTGTAGGRAPDASGTGPEGSRLPGTAGPGREGLTGDDRTPEDTPVPPPGPAGTEGLRPGAEGAGYGRVPVDAGPAAGAEPGEGFADRPRAGREGLMGDDRAPQDTPVPPPGPAGTEGLRPGAEGAGYGRAPADAGPAAGAAPGEGFADRPRAGREGFTGDDRAPQDTPPPPPGPAGAGAGQWHGTEQAGQAGQWHGTEGLRPGTEDMGAGADEGFGASHRAEREAISEEDRMPDNGLGAPAPGEASQREATTSDTPGRDAWPTAPGAPARDAGRSDTAPATGPVGTEPAASAGASAPTSASSQGSPLLAREEVEEWQRRMREVVGGFVDQPKGAVERADRTLEEIAARFSDAVTRRRRTLRMSWEGAEERGPGAETDTEQLRLALRDYRELAERLLRG